MKPAHDGTAQKGETSMKNRISNGIAVMAVAMIAICAAAPEAFGQNMQASNLTLKKTYVVTHTTPTWIYGQNWGGSVIIAPSGMIVNCPKGANCFLKVDVTLQASVSPGESLSLYSRVDYNDSAPQVAQVISGVIPNGFSETRSYSWFFEVPQGDHVVDVFCLDPQRSRRDDGAGFAHDFRFQVTYEGDARRGAAGRVSVAPRAAAREVSLDGTLEEG